ncbi:unnamed protein product [Caenorhabditis nigoni]
MVKIADCSFMLPLPTFQPTRHCCGCVSNRVIFHLLTALTIPQILCILAISILPIQKSFLPNFLKIDIPWCLIVIGAISIFWIISIILSFIALIEKIPYLMAPLGLIEAFFLISATSMSVAFAWSLSAQNSQNSKDSLFNGLLCLCMAIFHGFYTFCVYFEWKDGKKRREVEEFVSRQRVFDDVCDEMLREEQEAEEAAMRYEQQKHYRHHQLTRYTDESGSLSEYSVSICSSEMRVLYNESTVLQYHHPATVYYQNDTYPQYLPRHHAYDERDNDNVYI